METRHLTTSDRKIFDEFNSVILDALKNKEWFIPFDKDDPVLEESHDYFIGYFDGDKLAAISALIFDEHFLGELREITGLGGKKIAEVGGSMVLPEYRGQNLMLQLNRKLVSYARDKGYEYLVATVHPDNVASRTSAETLGFKLHSRFMRKGRFLRNLYVMKL